MRPTRCWTCRAPIVLGPTEPGYPIGWVHQQLETEHAAIPLCERCNRTPALTDSVYCLRCRNHILWATN
jgi:hypothetical protein